MQHEKETQNREQTQPSGSATAMNEPWATLLAQVYGIFLPGGLGW